MLQPTDLLYQTQLFADVDAALELCDLEPLVSSGLKCVLKFGSPETIGHHAYVPHLQLQYGLC